MKIAALLEWSLISIRKKNPTRRSFSFNTVNFYKKQKAGAQFGTSWYLKTSFTKLVKFNTVSHIYEIFASIEPRIGKLQHAYTVNNGSSEKDTHY